ncbi:MAG: PIN domain-containing protein [Planctomycetes bacterium]|nr:PIN domain-containing protein [Planctomycetota bacterium]
MKTSVILDTGPFVALLNGRDEYHAWTVETLKNVATPMLTCESVISEAVFLLRGSGGGLGAIARILRDGAIRITHSLALESELKRVRELLVAYRDLPISLADACLVRMSENHPRHKVLTLDNHFRVYRRADNKPIPLLIPN